VSFGQKICLAKSCGVLRLARTGQETGMRIGEAWQLKWTDIDEERLTIRCRPEKQQPTHIQSIIQTHSYAQHPTKNVRPSVRRHLP